jgi:hypothetical protein
MNTSENWIVIGANRSSKLSLPVLAVDCDYAKCCGNVNWHYMQLAAGLLPLDQSVAMQNAVQECFPNFLNKPTLAWCNQNGAAAVAAGVAAAVAAGAPVADATAASEAFVPVYIVHFKTFGEFIYAGHIDW